MLIVVGWCHNCVCARACRYTPQQVPDKIILPETASPGYQVFNNDPDRAFVYSQSNVLQYATDSNIFGFRQGTSIVEVLDSGYSFDYNKQNVYVVGVTSRDPVCGRTDTTKVAVRLVDYNNLPPVFPKREYTAELLENAPVKTQVIQIRAIDGDLSYPELTYTLYADDPTAPGLFEVRTEKEEDIEGNFVYKAVVYLAKALPKRGTDDLSTIKLVLEVDDGENSVDRSTLIIVISDINDNNPVFSKLASTSCVDATCIDQTAASVPEDIAFGTVLYQFVASDVDRGPNGQILFTTTVPDFSDPAFNDCDRSTGIFKATTVLANSTILGTGKVVQKYLGALVVARPLDFEVKPQYAICVVAMDGGVPSRHAHIRVLINVTDVPVRLRVVDTSSLQKDASGALFVPSNVRQPTLTFESNNEDNIPNALFRYRVDRVAPEDCVLTSWRNIGDCLGSDAKPLKTVAGLPCRAGANDITGQVEQSRHITQMRDALGLGADCPRINFEDAEYSNYNAGAVLLRRWTTCGQDLCSVLSQAGGQRTQQPPQTSPVANATLQAQWLASMSKVPRNGFLRNHPLMDGWAYKLKWLPQANWNAFVTQTITWTAARYTKKYGARGRWVACPASPGPAPTCDVAVGNLDDGVHVVDVEVVDGTVDTGVFVVGIAATFMMDHDTPVPFFAKAPGRCNDAKASAVTTRTCKSRIVAGESSARFDLLFHDTDTANCVFPLCKPGTDFKACAVCDRGTAVKYMCRIDDPTYSKDLTPCPTRKFGDVVRPQVVSIFLANLTDGPHYLEVQAVDAAGNIRSTLSPLRYIWDVDTRAPMGIISQWPAKRQSASSSAFFEFTSDEQDSTFNCELDGVRSSCGNGASGRYSASGMGSRNLTNLAHGWHTFRVIASDAAGNEAASGVVPTYTWQVDRQGPQIKFVTTPGRTMYPYGDVTNEHEWTAQFWADEPVTKYECRFSSLAIKDQHGCCDQAFAAEFASCVDVCGKGDADDVKSCAPKTPAFNAARRK